jgi:predicted enzyme related to lactoylglutathione lyase
MPAKLSFVIDCADPETLAGFWAPALGYQNAGTFGSYVALVADGAPMFLLQRVPEPKQGKLRMHVDFKVPDVEAEVERLVALGAKRISDAPVTEHGAQWVVMNDPEGNEFCVCRDP